MKSNLVSEAEEVKESKIKLNTLKKSNENRKKETMKSLTMNVEHSENVSKRKRIDWEKFI